MKEKVRVLAKKILNKRSNQVNIYMHDKMIQHFLLDWIKKRRFKNILLFYPMRHEVDLICLMHQLRQKKLNVFVPCIKGKTMFVQRLRFPLKRGQYNILESGSSSCYEGEIDLAVVPILAFDSDLRRIGFGQGYYDHFFARLLAKPYIIFLSRYPVFSKKPVTNFRDIRADMVLFSKVFLRLGKHNANSRSKPYIFDFNRNDWALSDF
ncbi:5-formyltetrahydrofolate cyclo-ligase [Helicobacter kayseriensis]|uniref:5-formyltetrahydrofolate cyclo-ligase n=1 Tax=Helicobacter kayseriensis TaxID=2905877 RepID=UPI001E605B11|nr:5-formyltetrahydrofolate cyclo-ligase [Helicobacter kayseriensis]MCE3046570.1 5-formyltetrahydrofolate cyclo-ligase [Helicobacter kayseriensis]MCE3048128.1 5-formyltetrahydrofolate cyclo-ligase [Helicobacter kayseriensis]